MLCIFPSNILSLFSWGSFLWLDQDGGCSSGLPCRPYYCQQQKADGFFPDLLYRAREAFPRNLPKDFHSSLARIVSHVPAYPNDWWAQTSQTEAWGIPDCQNKFRGIFKFQGNPRNSGHLLDTWIASSRYLYCQCWIPLHSIHHAVTLRSFQWLLKLKKY